MSGRIVRPETPQGLEFPEIGRLHIGMKNDKGYPMSIDWFRATGKYADKFTEAYGEKPNTIQIIFPSDKVEYVCNERYEYRDNAGALLSDGDGKDFRLWCIRQSNIRTSWIGLSRTIRQSEVRKIGILR